MEPEARSGGMIAAWPTPARSVSVTEPSFARGPYGQADPCASGLLRVAAVRPGMVRLEWTVLERRGATRAASLEMCTETGALACPRAFSHWSDAPGARSHLLVAPDIVTFFQLRRAMAGESIFPFVVVAPVSCDGLPPDWLDRGYWDFERITILSDGLADPAPLVAVLADQGHRAAGVAVPCGAQTWRSWAQGLRRLDHAAIARIEAGALPVGDFERVRLADADAGDWLRRGCRTLDDRGRLCRMARVRRRRSDASPSARLILVRSDMTSSELVTARPRRVDSSLSAAGLDASSASPYGGWREVSVASYLDGREPVSSRLLGERLSRAFMEALGLEPPPARVMAGYVALTYVFPAFDELPMLVVRGGSSSSRFAARRLLAATTCEPAVAGRARAAQLARIAAAGSGVMVLEEPGPACGPSGATELGRFLESSLVRHASAYNAVNGRHGLRALDVFGPRIVIAACAATAGLACNVVAVDLPEDDGGRRVGAVLAPDDLRDDLSAWSMGSFASLKAMAGALPVHRLLPVIMQDLYGDEELVPFVIAAGRDPAAGDDFVGKDTGPSPARMMEDVMAACGGGDHLAMVQVMLEIALRGGGGPSLSPEHVGRWLASHPRIDTERPTDRRRLHGQISRIYPLGAAAGQDVDPTSAFRFCLDRACGGCRYEGVCGSVFPEMKRRKIGL